MTIIRSCDPVLQCDPVVVESLNCPVERSSLCIGDVGAEVVLMVVMLPTQADFRGNGRRAMAQVQYTTAALSHVSSPPLAVSYPSR